MREVDWGGLGRVLGSLRDALGSFGDALRNFIVASGSSMSPPPYRVTTFFRRCLLGAFLSKILTKIKVLDGTLRYCVARSQRPTTTTSISGPDQPQFHVQIDLNFRSRSTSISGPDQSQFYVQIDLNSTSRSISIARPNHAS